MVEHLTGALTQQTFDVFPFNLIHTDIGELAKELVDAATVVLASPTVLGGAHPAVCLRHLPGQCPAAENEIRLDHRLLRLGRAHAGNPAASLGNIKVELLEPVLAKGYPREPITRPWTTLAAAIAASTAASASCPESRQLPCNWPAIAVKIIGVTAI